MAISFFGNEIAMVYLIAFILGAIVGSFLNVCIIRIPKGDSIVHPPSHCPDCKTAIRFYDNIPLVSYIALLGRCRSCGEKISPRYLFVELLMGSFAVALYCHVGLLFSVVARYVISDPFELIPSPLSALIGVLVGGGFLLALAWAYEAFTG